MAQRGIRLHRPVFEIVCEKPQHDFALIEFGDGSADVTSISPA
jgi:hypothetical protein